MEIDQEMVRQVVLSAGAVALFIVATVAVSAAFGSHAAVNESVDGSLNGTLAEGAVSGDSVDGSFRGTLENGFAGPEAVNGTISGSIGESDRVTGTLEGNAVGTVDGTVSGAVNATYNRSTGVLTGEFEGTVSGIDAETTVEPAGGLALVGVLGGFIFLMAVAGMWLERQDFDS